MVIRSICFIGKLNQPLCFRCYGGGSELSFQMAIYGALDYIDSLVSDQQQIEKVDSSTNRPTIVLSADPYLGYLGPALGHTSGLSLTALETASLSSSVGLKQESVSYPSLLPTDLAIFGYFTSTRLKIVAILEETVSYNDPDLRPFFRHLHRLYTDCISNPFFVDNLNTPRFLKALDQSVSYYSRSLLIN